MTLDGQMPFRVPRTIGYATSDRVVLRDRDLSDLFGRCTFAEVAYLTWTGRMPTPGEAKVLDAVLISLVDHGVTPSALAARLTYSSAPEALQGAVAAGLLGAGTVLLGSMEAAGQLLEELADTDPADGARHVVQTWRDEGRRIPGLGHALHKAGDPRVEPLLRVADEAGLSGRYVAAIRGLPSAMEAVTGHRLPVNATGAVAALLLELGLPWQMHRGVALASRAVGLVAHVMDEAADPVSPALREAFRATPDGGETR